MIRTAKAFCLSVAIVLCLPASPRANADNRMYWTDASERTISSAALDGTGAALIAPTGAAPQSLALDIAGGKIYWAEADGKAIRRANLDGTGVENLVTGVGPAGIALDVAHGKVYWTDVFVNGYIQRSNLDGSAVENLVTIVGDREGMAIDHVHGKIYWTNRSWQSIERSNLDGSGWEFVIPSGLADPRGIAIDEAGGKIYWVEIGTRSVRRANLDGTGIVDLVTSGLETPSGLALDVAAGRMYWTDFGNHTIKRANLDGSGVELLLSGLTLPVGIALDSGPQIVDVSIDIKPESPVNRLGLASNAELRVAILSSATFDATQIDVTTIAVAGPAIGLLGSATSCASRDVSKDGHTDLICRVQMDRGSLRAGTSTVTLEAKLANGQPVKGTDSLTLVKGTP